MRSRMASATRVLMRLPVIEAEHLLLKYWSDFGHSTHFFQAALYVATPELLSRADMVIRASSDPETLLQHVVMHFGITMGDEVGVTREAQVRAIAPYFRLLRPDDLRNFARTCNENGWYALRRQLVDPERDPDEVESPSFFRRRLDVGLERGGAPFLDHDVDDMLKADVGWSDLAESLREWLAAQTSILALDIADSAIRHAGNQGDATILSVWRGADRSLLTAKIVDLDFALRRRTRSER